MSTYTEKEAKERWCPFARVWSTTSYGYAAAPNRTEGGRHIGSECIGSACMSWREDKRFGEPGKRPGYCGLAGKPE